MVITGTTGNRVYPKRVPRVQIPPAPPEQIPIHTDGDSFLSTHLRRDLKIYMKQSDGLFPDAGRDRIRSLIFPFLLERENANKSLLLRHNKNPNPYGLGFL